MALSRTRELRRWWSAPAGWAAREGERAALKELELAEREGGNAAAGGGKGGATAAGGVGCNKAGARGGGGGGAACGAAARGAGPGRRGRGWLVAWHRRHAAAAALGPLSESVSGSRPARAGWARCHCRGKETRRGREAGRRGRWARAGRAWLLHRSQRSSALWRWRRSRRQASGGGGAEAEAERGGRALLPRSAPCMLASWSSSPPSSSARSSSRRSSVGVVGRHLRLPRPAGGGGNGDEREQRRRRICSAGEGACEYRTLQTTARWCGIN